MDKTYLIERLEIWRLFGIKEVKTAITEISSQNFGMIKERNQTLQVSTEKITLMKQFTACLYTYKIFNTGTVYIKMVTFVTSICLSCTLYIINIP